jgi:hypothetical protein
VTAAIIIGHTAGAQRFPTDGHFARHAGTAPVPASSGTTQRHRLHRGGDRQLNRAIHIIALSRANTDPETRAYLARKHAEGKTKLEAIRCLKRHLARRIWRLLYTAETPAPTHANQSLENRKYRTSLDIGAAKALARQPLGWGRKDSSDARDRGTYVRAWEPMHSGHRGWLRRAVSPRGGGCWLRWQRVPAGSPYCSGCTADRCRR